MKDLIHAVYKKGDKVRLLGGSSKIYSILDVYKPTENQPLYEYRIGRKPRFKGKIMKHGLFTWRVNENQIISAKNEHQNINQRN